MKIRDAIPKTPRYFFIRLMVAFVFIILIGIGCGGGGSSNSNDESTTDDNSTADSTTIAENEIIVATYNILNGAGVETLLPGNKKWVENHGYPGNRLQEVIDVINYIDPDILGIQEAHQWELGEPAVVQEVADQLGMNYFFGESTNPDAGFCSVAIFTKFDIIESENFPGNFTRAGLRVKIEMPNGKIINVFVAHLDSNTQKTRIMEASFIVSEMAPFIDDYSIIMGDMNFSDPSTEANVLYEAGWLHPLKAQQDIDQIWTSSTIKPYVRSWGTVPIELTASASDHTPSVAIIGIPK